MSFLTTLISDHPKARNELLQMNYLKPNAIFQLTSPNDRYRLECVNNEYIGNYQDLRKYYRAFFGVSLFIVS